MSRLYSIAGISKQGFHQALERELRGKEEQAQLEKIIRTIRKDHPRMGCRQLYDKIHPASMGRDRFEAFCKQRGFYLPIERRFRATTDSRGVPRVPNLLHMMDQIQRVNQVWVSDITYFELNGRFCYLTLIQDLFSREIVGHQASMDLSTVNTTLSALRRAIAKRGITPQDQVILHSDGGGQYFAKDFLSTCKQYGIRSSRAEDVYDNAHAERLNRTIKNDYLIPYAPASFEELTKMLTKAVGLYNCARPHRSIGKYQPEEFARLTSAGLLTKTLVINKRKKEAKKEKVNISMRMI